MMEINEINSKPVQWQGEDVNTTQKSPARFLVALTAEPLCWWKVALHKILIIVFY